MIALQNIKFAPNTCIFWEGKLRLVVQRVVKKKKKKVSKTLYLPDDLIRICSSNPELLLH